jgi:acetyl-CoA synthetase
MSNSPETSAFRAARDLLLARASDYEAAVAEFRWPELGGFNWALDWFDVVAAEHPDRAALWIVQEDGAEARLTYEELARRSARVAVWLRSLGVGRGDRVLVMLPNRVELWEVTLAAMKLGCVLVPSTTLLAASDVADRIARGRVDHVVADESVANVVGAVPGPWTRVVVGAAPGWRPYAESVGSSAEFSRDGETNADDPLFLYFTSGTTSKPKLVEHTYASYPAGHLSTMYWIGLRPGDVHMNISSPGWAKHAWSNVFAPWNAQATVFVYDYKRFDARAMLDVLHRCEVTTMCAPPTVWRLLIQADLGAAPSRLRAAVAAGEPLNPEVIERVRRAWGVTIRDGYGQTETTAQIGNTPGQPLKPGSMGRPLPGYAVELVDPTSGERAGDEGEICIDLARRPAALMRGYLDDSEQTAAAMAGGYYHTGDLASRDADGYITYVGRTDDVFKASDYRISPFELESVLIEHAAVAEAAVVPSPHPLRLAVPKAFVVLAEGWAPTRETALAILRHARVRLAPYQRVRRLEFAELPKTISGKIRRAELRAREAARAASDSPNAGEWRDEDFPELRSSPHVEA